jgi:protease-4
MATLSSSISWGWVLAILIGLLAVAGLFLLVFGGSGTGIVKGCIGVIEVKGEIVAEDSAGSLFGAGQSGSSTIAGLIEEAERRADVKAILVEINSPGGSTTGSREIYQALKNSKKPKVAYLREMAASGGYYVAVGTDYIVSEPDALTGSIGVRSTFTDLSGLFAKLGYNETVIKSGELKDMGSSSRPPAEEELRIMQAIVNESFEEFKEVVVLGRGSRLKHPQFEEVLDARVLSGRQALAIGMVDSLGGRKEAVLKAGELAGDKTLGTCTIQTEQHGLLSRLLSGTLALPLPRMSGGWNLQYS